MLAPGTQDENPALYQILQKMVLDAGAELHERQIRALINRPDATTVLQQLSVPTLFVAGEHDGWSTPARHSQMAEQVSDAEVQQLNGVGHFLQVEAPDEFSQILLDWTGRQRLVEHRKAFALCLITGALERVPSDSHPSHHQSAVSDDKGYAAQSSYARRLKLRHALPPVVR